VEGKVVLSRGFIVPNIQEIPATIHQVMAIMQRYLMQLPPMVANRMSSIIAKMVA
jgi:hypothetical protein